MDYYLQHHGIKGMKWGVRRYQNKDGSLTPAGKKRQAKELAKSWTPQAKNMGSVPADAKYKGVKVKRNGDGYTVQERWKVKSEKQRLREADKAIKKDRYSASKNRRTLSDSDLDARINRLKKEQQLRELTDADLRPGRTAVRKFIATSGGKVITAAATGALAYAGYSFMESNGFAKAANYIFPNPNKKK